MSEEYAEINAARSAAKAAKAESKVANRYADSPF
jgi:hypothetical protein